MDQSERKKFLLEEISKKHNQLIKNSTDILLFLLKSLFAVNGFSILAILTSGSQVVKIDPNHSKQVAQILSRTVENFSYGLAAVVLAILFAWGYVDLKGTHLIGRSIDISKINDDDAMSTFISKLESGDREKGVSFTALCTFAFIILSFVFFIIGLFTGVEIFSEIGK